ncbi:putative monooxygenase [Talaromyces proteolyticus]|uniref:Monooxygenase n=1 Tax=Talaromyces proteolyticus TaxID=1131652 RepID=A0AAD4L683_9EURO|nr:putative monooxygenase [Talaromyces proteolyticus]KAH8704704.1 putative monooxygenase [Talaromyces proteolyticus]
MKDKESYDVIIIGAGWYGLIAATTYLRLAPDTNMLIVDNGKSIGGVWSKERIYPNLFAQVGHGLFEYSFYPMKKEGLTPDRYISGNTIHNYLYSFAKDYDLVRRTRLETTVTNVEKMVSGSWRLDILGDKPLWASKLIVATGVSSEPYIPTWPKEGFSKPIIHSAQTGTSLDELHSLAVKRVVVLGAAKSAYDTVFLLLKAGKKVDWIIRDEGSGPLAIMPPRLLGIFNTVDLMGTRALAAFSPAILGTRGAWYQLLHQNSIGRFITMKFWNVLTAVAEYQAGYHKSSNAEKLRPIPKGYGIFWANSGLGLASVPDFWKTFHAGGATVHRTEIASYSDGNKVNLKNGTSLETDFVVLCTGWTDALGPFKQDLRVQFGLPSDQDFNSKWQKLDDQAEETVNKALPILTNPPDTFVPSASQRRPWRLYRRLISPRMAAQGDRSIFFPGQIHSVYTPLVAEIQALWGVSFLLNQLEIPDQREMEEEVAVWNAWTRKRYLEQGRKHAYSIYDYLAYVDTLARDLGINPNRKCNPIAEMFSTYVPSDYKGLIDEYLHTQEKKRLKLFKTGVRANGHTNGHTNGHANGYH